MSRKSYKFGTKEYSENLEKLIALQKLERMSYYGYDLAPAAAAMLAPRKPNAAPRKSYKAMRKGKAASRPKYKNPRTGGYLGIENKFVDYEKSASIVDTVAGAEFDPTEGALNAIAQGDGESQRDGRKVTVRSVHVKGYISLPAQSGSAMRSRIVRVLLLLDTQTNGAQFNSEDVLVDPTSTALDPFTFRNLQYTNRFRVLKDISITLNPDVISTTANGDRVAQVNMHHYFKNGLSVCFNGTTANVSTIADHSLHIMAISSGTSGGTACTLNYFSRVRFVG